MKRVLLAATTIAFAIVVACKDDPAPPPSAPAADAGLDGDADASACLTGYEGDIIRALAGHAWVREGFVDELEGNYRAVDVVCNETSVNDAQPIYQFFDGAPDPTCTIVVSIEGRDARKNQSTRCPDLPSTLYDTCNRIAFIYAPREPTTPINTLLLREIFLYADGTAKEESEFDLEVKMRNDGKMMLHNDNGEGGWGIYGDVPTTDFCRAGVK